MKKLYLSIILSLYVTSAFAQWQVPAGNVPVGRGDPIQGFTSIAPGSNGNCLQVSGLAWVSSACVASSVPLSGITGLGTGVGTALGTAVGTTGGPVTNGGVLGTPSSGVGTNLTALSATQLTTGTIPNARIAALPNANLANSAITLSGKSTALGASFNPARATQVGGSIGAGTAAGPVMGGLGGTLSLTPTTTGNAIVIGGWTVSNSVASDGCTLSFAYGTGTAPAHNAAPVGTVVGTSMSQVGYGAANYSSSLSNVVYVTGLILGTTYWFDIQYSANVGGTCSVASSAITVLEMWQ